MPVSTVAIGRMYCGVRIPGEDHFTACVTTHGYKFSTRYRRDLPIKMTMTVRTLHVWRVDKTGSDEKRYLEIGDVVDLKVAGPQDTYGRLELREITDAKVTKVKRVESLTGDRCPFRKYTFEYDGRNEKISYPNNCDSWDEPKTHTEPPMLRADTEEFVDAVVSDGSQKSYDEIATYFGTYLSSQDLNQEMIDASVKTSEQGIHHHECFDEPRTTAMQQLIDERYEAETKLTENLDVLCEPIGGLENTEVVFESADIIEERMISAQEEQSEILRQLVLSAMPEEIPNKPEMRLRRLIYQGRRLLFVVRPTDLIEQLIAANGYKLQTTFIASIKNDAAGTIDLMKAEFETVLENEAAGAPRDYLFNEAWLEGPGWDAVQEWS